ncbi:class I SAM-dependent methyltransferase [Phosphitispora fastidiosa]|uniref:class I SAM-dependent methyltransferase n=1 Tax=Phosphitispora fastidiosa TaxID=2837202 RepID=UPI001E310F02|nr:class I SAM-dependent methyltransferase [Phosphitispora fastidiosa]MBU7008552.1 ubiquinone/menaquinone biosynthesis C-methylase UbiE [Phosphitispora fastidiosa]
MDNDVEKIVQLNILKIAEIPDDYWQKFTSSEKQLKRIAMMMEYEYGDKVLEIGPSRGYLAIAICKTKKNIVKYDALEIDAAFVSQCREMANLNHVKNINCIQGDGCNLRHLNKNYYNTVIMAEVLEHVHTPLKMLREANSVLANGGWAIVTVPSKGLMPPEKTSDHVQDFSVKDVRKLISKAGFRLLHHTKCHSWEFYLGVKQNFSGFYSFFR